MKLTIVPVTYNSREHIAATIEALELAIDGIDAEIVMVENDSTDDTIELARSKLKHGRIIELDENIGFGPGANVGLSHAHGEYTLIMNDDVHPVGNCLEQLIDVLAADPSIGLVGARMLHPDGTEADATRKRLPGLIDETARVVDRLKGQRHRNAYPESTEPVDVGLLIAAFVMGRTEQLRQLGGFNDSFFFYGEDIDLCRRLQKNGFRTVTVPGAVAVHDQDVAVERRFAGRDFRQRILNARSRYYRIWLGRPERMAIHAWRAIGPSDQPFRFKYHTRRAIWDGRSLKDQQTLEPLARIGDSQAPEGDPGAK